MGKTVLAAEVAARRISENKGPVLWLRMGPSETDAVFQAVALPFDDKSDDQKSIARAIGDEKILAMRKLLIDAGIKFLVLDDCWNVRALNALLRAVPRDAETPIPVLVTSRQRYALDRIIDVNDLSIEEALELLSYHARFNYREDANARALCLKLSNLPFSIEVAGKVTKIFKWTASELLQKIAEAPHKLTLESAEEGRSNIAQLLEVSLNALDNETRNVFLALGAFFSVNITPEPLAIYLGKTKAPEVQWVDWGENQKLPIAVLSNIPIFDTDSAEKALDRLAVSGLAVRVPTVANVTPHFQIHALAYSYVRDQNDDHARSKAVDACLAYLKHHDKLSKENFESFRLNMDNFIGATEWAFRTKRYSETEHLATRLYADGQMLAAGLAVEAATLLNYAISSAEKRGDKKSQASYLLALGTTSIGLGQIDRVIDCFEQALAIYRERKDRRNQGVALNNLGKSYWLSGQYDKAIFCLNEAIEIYREMNDKRGEEQALGDLGDVYLHSDKYRQAVEHYAQALAVAQEIGDQSLESKELTAIGRVFANLGDEIKANEYFEQALSIQRKTGDAIGEVMTLLNLGFLYTTMGNYDRAIQYYTQARSLGVWGEEIDAIIAAAEEQRNSRAEGEGQE